MNSQIDDNGIVRLRSVIINHIRYVLLVMTIKLTERKTQSIQMQNSHNHSHAANGFGVVPLTERLRVDERFTGRGIVIAFLDSGFYPHDDLENRIVAFHDAGGDEDSLEKLKKPQAGGNQDFAAREISL